MDEQIHTMILERFVDHIVEGSKANIKYCFIIGSGASKSSGIPTGLDMIREWRSELMTKSEAYLLLQHGEIRHES